MRSFFTRFDGWWQAFYMACISFPLYNIGAKIAISDYGVNPLIFLCFGSLSSSLILILAAGRGRLAIRSIRTLDTWLFSFLNLSAVAFGVSLLYYVSALQGSVLIRFSAIACFLIAFVMGQRTNKNEVLLTILSFAGLTVMFLGLEIPKEQKATALLLLFGAGVCQALRQLLAEFHKTNNMAKTLKENLRVSGVVAAVSAFTFTLVLFSLSLYQSILDVKVISAIPDLKDFFSLPALVCAVLFAGFLSAGSKYCEFYATKTISAKYVSSIIALMPLFVMLYSYIYDLIKGVESWNISNNDILATAMVITGNLGIAVLAIRSSKKQKESELREKNLLSSDENVRHVAQLVSATMQFTRNDIDKTARLLGINKDLTVDLIALEDQEDYELSVEKFNLINQNYYLNISTKDNLTSLLNRGALEHKAKELINNNMPFSLAFIDLNKFKKINDTLGHDAGDEVLKHVAKSMLNANPNGVNARNGGDEFVMLIFNDIDNIIELFNANLAKALEYKDNKIVVSASVGAVNYESGEIDLETLIKQADEHMYFNKNKDR